MFKKEKNGKTNKNPLKEASLLVFLFIFFIILLAIISTKIKIQIVNCKFSSNVINKRHFNENYKIIIKLYILSKIPIIKINITKEKLEKWKMKQKLSKNIEKLEKQIINDNNKIDKRIIEAIKKVKIEFKKIDLNIELSTENAFLTSIIVPAISTIIVIFLSRKISKYENQQFIMKPVYYNQNMINLSFSGIFEFKLIHIINMIYILNKKGRVNLYERTSNRRSYDYSYE